MSAADRWREYLASWAIPPEILAAARESPWDFPVALFASRAEAARGLLTPSNRRALEALPEGGSVLDVGCGGGAASLPLAGRAARVIGLDTSAGMLAAFLDLARGAGLEAEVVTGRWPDAASRSPVADVVVCHHVAYNVPDLASFARRLTEHARSRVVMELTAGHPTGNLDPLWLRFHGVVRPTRPTADDAEAVLRETGLAPDREDWTASRPGGYQTVPDMVAHVRRLLCLPPDRDPEIEQALADMIEERDGRFGFPDRPVVTLWWGGSPA